MIAVLCWILLLFIYFVYLYQLQPLLSDLPLEFTFVLIHFYLLLILEQWKTEVAMNGDTLPSTIEHWWPIQHFYLILELNEPPFSYRNSRQSEASPPSLSLSAWWLYLHQQFSNLKVLSNRNSRFMCMCVCVWQFGNVAMIAQ